MFVYCFIFVCCVGSGFCDLLIVVQNIPTGFMYLIACEERGGLWPDVSCSATDNTTRSSEDEVTTVLLNADNYLPIDTA